MGLSGFAPDGNHFGGYDAWAFKIDSTGNLQWEKLFGGSGDETFWQIFPTGEGGYIFGGHSTSEVEGNKTAPNYGSSDMWVVKVDSNGVKQWDKTYGTSSEEYLRTMVSLPDGGFLLGGESGGGIDGTRTAVSRGSFDYWVVKTDHWRPTTVTRHLIS